MLTPRVEERRVERTPISLLERLRRPEDETAWKQFVHLYTPMLYGWALKTGLSDASAADLVQDVFLVVVQQLPSFQYQHGGSFRAWLRTILMNRWRTWQRRPQPQTVRPEQLDELSASAESELPGEAEERCQLVRRALTLVEREVEPVTWQAFRQYVLEGQAPAAVAAALGVKVNVVYLAKSRVFQRLRRLLEGLVDNE
jgi:RNA polymerase sigma-70 factor (ECF subfamily)